MEFRQLHISFIVLMGILSFGTCGFWYVEGMSFFDALYMTLITISTVGFSEIHPLSPQGRVITMIVIVMGVSIGGYSMAVVVRGLIEGELRKGFERKKMEKEIQNLRNHFIICGFGRIGGIVCRELHEDRMKFVVIEQDDEAANDIEKLKYLYLKMDATDEEALIKAGIHRARGLVTAVRSDANNVFITLTAKGIRPDIFVMSRTSDVKNEGKLKRAGATRVVSPYFIGGRRMAQILKQPTVVDFIDIATMGNKLGLIMDEARIRTESSLIGRDLVKSNLRRDYGVIIVAIKKPSGKMIFNPLPTQVLEENDVLVIIGKKEDVTRMYEVM